MSNFVRHEPCPRCMSKDNLGVWDDGHKYCFGCGYKVPPTGMSMSVFKRLDIQQPGKYGKLTFEYAPVIPHKALLWLKSYGITDEEMIKYDIGWSPLYSSLIFPYYVDKEVRYASMRYFGEDKKQPKSKTIGKKDKLLQVGREDTDTLIFVEDPISAIKVGRSFAAIPVLGSHVPLEALEEATRRYKNVGVWLDPDMCLRSAKAVLRGRMLTGKNVFQIRTQYDPKFYSDEEIQRFVKGTN